MDFKRPFGLKALGLTLGKIGARDLAEALEYAKRAPIAVECPTNDELWKELRDKARQQKNQYCPASLESRPTRKVSLPYKDDD